MKTEIKEYFLQKLTQDMDRDGWSQMISYFPHLFLIDRDLSSLDSNDYNGGKAFLAKMAQANNNSNYDVTMHIKEKTNFINSLVKFKNNKQPVKKENCGAVGLTKSDIIKCAAETDNNNNIDKVITLIDTAFTKHYSDETLSILAIFIAEGRDFALQFSDQLEPISVPGYLNTNFDLSVLAHEAYHSGVQDMLFDNDDFGNAENAIASKEKYLTALKEVYKNVIKLANSDQEVNHIDDLFELAALIIKNIPDIGSFDGCNPDMAAIWKENSRIYDIKINEIDWYSQHTLPFTLDDVEDLDQFFQKNDLYCQSIAKKYNYTQEQFNLLGRVDYFLTCPNFNLENNIVPDSECKSLSPEAMPSVFQLIERGISTDALMIFQPLVDYFEDVQKVIDLRKQAHIDHYCAPFVNWYTQFEAIEHCTSLKNDNQACMFQEQKVGICITDLTNYQV